MAAYLADMALAVLVVVVEPLVYGQVAKTLLDRGNVDHSWQSS